MDDEHPDLKIYTRFQWYYIIDGVRYGPTTDVYTEKEVRKWIRKQRGLRRLPPNMPLMPALSYIHPNQVDQEETTESPKYNRRGMPWGSR